MTIFLKVTPIYFKLKIYYSDVFKTISNFK